MATVIGDSPSGAPDWSNAAGIYDEFRVLGWKHVFRPNNQYSKTTVVCRPGYAIIDRADSTALSSYSDAVSYASRKDITLENIWTMQSKMREINEATWQTTASPASKVWLKIYFDGLSLTTEYGILETIFLVQFKGKR